MTDFEISLILFIFARYFRVVEIFVRKMINR